MPANAAPFPIKRTDLGELERLYETRSFSPIRILAYASCAIAVALGTALLKVSQEPGASEDALDIGPKVAIGLFVLAFGCLLAGLLYKVKANRVALFQHGVAIEAEGTVEAARWDEVHHYFNTELGEPFRFSLRNQTELSISNDTAGFGELCAEVRRRSGDFILEREYANLASAGSAVFGPLTLTRDGIRVEGKSLAWTEIHKMYARITYGRETLTFDTGWTPGIGVGIASEKIPSFHVCRELITRVAPAHLLVTEG